MIRPAVLPAVACLFLGGCITNTQATQNSQLDVNGVGARPTLARPVARRTSTAVLASARLIEVHKTTISGATLRLAAPQALDPDCSPMGEVVVKVTAPPDHGAVNVAPGLIFSEFSPGDPPFMCNARKTPATLITYQATAGYVGDDVAVIQIFFPDGHAPTVRYDITVR